MHTFDMYVIEFVLLTLTKIYIHLSGVEFT
jgi:hypothetical protein